jgi:phage gp46-like protein
MSDVKLSMNTSGLIDISVVNSDIESDDGLETTVLISLFSDAVISSGELLPEHCGDRRGWFGDDVAGDGDTTGSNLWLLDRAKINTAKLGSIVDKCKEALKWMTDDGVAKSVDVTAERNGLYTVNISISIVKPDDVLKKYVYVWNYQEAL